MEHLARTDLAELLLARVSGPEGVERHVAIKRLRAEHAADRAVVDTFLSEARLAATLHHQHIVQVTDIGEQDGVPYVAMEYVHGEELRRVLARVHELGEQVPLPHVVAIGIAAATGLHAAHEQTGSDAKALEIVHRDVSPANILLGYDGNLKLLDFGIARATLRTAQTQTQMLRGKAPYMSPEQCSGKKLDRRSDVFALGIVLYELATCRRLFKASNEYLTMAAIVTCQVPPPSSRRADLPKPLEDVILRALSRDPASRFQSAQQMIEALDAIAPRSPPSALAAYVRQLFGDRPEPWTAPHAPRAPVHVDFDGKGTGLAPPPAEALQTKVAPAPLKTKPSPIEAARVQALAATSPVVIPEGTPRKDPTAPVVFPGARARGATRAPVPPPTRQRPKTIQIPTSGFATPRTDTTLTGLGVVTGDVTISGTGVATMAAPAMPATHATLSGIGVMVPPTSGFEAGGATTEIVAALAIETTVDAPIANASIVAAAGAVKAARNRSRSSGTIEVDAPAAPTGRGRSRSSGLSNAVVAEPIQITGSTPAASEPGTEPTELAAVPTDALVGGSSGDIAETGAKRRSGDSSSTKARKGRGKAKSSLSNAVIAAPIRVTDSIAAESVATDTRVATIPAAIDTRLEPGATMPAATGTGVEPGATMPAPADSAETVDRASSGSSAQPAASALASAPSGVPRLSVMAFAARPREVSTLTPLVLPPTTPLSAPIPIIPAATLDDSWDSSAFPAPPSATAFVPMGAGDAARISTPLALGDDPDSSAVLTPSFVGAVEILESPDRNRTEIVAPLPPPRPSAQAGDAWANGEDDLDTWPRQRRWWPFAAAAGAAVLLVIVLSVALSGGNKTTSVPPVGAEPRTPAPASNTAVVPVAPTLPVAVDSAGQPSATSGESNADSPAQPSGESTAAVTAPSTGAPGSASSVATTAQPPPSSTSNGSNLATIAQPGATTRTAPSSNQPASSKLVTTAKPGTSNAATSGQRGATTRTVPNSNQPTSSRVVTTAKPTSKPPTTSKITTTAQPATTSKTTSKVTTTAKPATASKVTTAKPAATSKVTTAKPAATSKLTTTAKPAATSKVSTTARPAATSKLTTTAKPATASKVSTTARPAATSKLTTTAKPAATSKVGTTARPTATSKLTTPAKPATTSKLAKPAAATAKSKPVSTAKQPPAAAKKPVPVAKPVAKAKK